MLPVGGELLDEYIFRLGYEIGDVDDRHRVSADNAQNLTRSRRFKRMPQLQRRQRTD